MNLAPDPTSLDPAAIRAVFFDFGDTLAEPFPSRPALFLEAARSQGLELDLDAIQRAYQIVDFCNKYSSVHTGDRDVFYRSYNEQLCGALGISSHSAELCPAIAGRFRSGKRWQLMDDASETLGRLEKRRIPLAVVSNWDSSLAALTEELGIRQFFTTIVPSQMVDMEKPDPAIFLRAADEMSLNAQSDLILYVGNEYRADVVGARAAGLIPVLIDRTALYPHADCLRFDSLRQWVDSLEASVSSSP